MTDFTTLARLLEDRLRQSASLHDRFLRNRADGMRGMQSLIARQMGGSLPHKQALITGEQLEAFSLGRYSECFGPRFARYDGRRIPRIPNGDLRMMSRVTAIQAETGTVRPPASVTVEYDVPPDAWYLQERAEIPYALWMEIALQACGLLSAYLDTYALVSQQEYFFRNLDGTARLLAEIDPRGVTLSTRANLLSSVVSGGTVIQKFGFTVSAAGQTLYEGVSNFGYFSGETMRNQQGLDGGRQTVPCLRAENIPAREIALPGPKSRLRQLDRIFAAPEGGRYGQGCLYAAIPVDPDGWFFPFHFDGDPVMPGSLGVEAMLELLRGYAVDRFGASAAQASSADPDTTFSWRYRGQITREHRAMELEAHIRGVEQVDSRTRLSADAALWVDGLRIYEIKNAALVWAS